MSRIPVSIFLFTLLAGCTDSQPEPQRASVAASVSADLPELPLSPTVQAAVRRFDRELEAIRASSASAEAGSDFATSLLARAEAAQAVRRLADRPTVLSGFDALQAQTYMAGQIQQLDTANAVFLEQYLPTQGWFDSKRYGERISNSAFLITQHSSDQRLMRLALARMQSAGVAAPADLRRHALLSDRIAVAERRPQAYGTQLICNDQGVLVMYQIEDAQHVEERRKSRGFAETLTEYTARIPNFEKACF